MEKRVLKDHTACALFNSRACAILNTRSCAECPLSRKDSDGDKPAIVQGFVDQFETLLPEGGVAPLFESETCTLCKTEPKGKRSCYAILDFGHEEPKELHARRLFHKKGVGFMMPLQFACCRKCRSRFLLASYLPLLVPTLLTALLIPFFVEPHLMQALRRVAAWLPLLLVVLTAGGGYLLGKLLQAKLKKRFETVMYFDLWQHPVTKSVLDKGWFPLFGEKQAQPIFSNKRIRYGIGTAPSEAYVRKIPENGESID